MSESSRGVGGNVLKNGLQGIFLNPSETIEYILKNGKSLIRWGDGETCILRDMDIYFQKSSPALKSHLYKILESYRQNETAFLLALPTGFLQMSDQQLHQLKLYNIWEHTRKLFSIYCSRGKTYGDAFVFRPDPAVKTASNKEIARLWKDTEHIIFIHSNKQYYKDFQRCLKKPIYFIQIPENDAFDQYTSIYQEVLELIRKQNLRKDRVKILSLCRARSKSFGL